MSVLFDGEIDVHYRFIFLCPVDSGPNGEFGRGGQVNGLCGAAQPGVLSLKTGLHTGNVPIVVEALEAEPEVEPDWEEVVEVSFTTERTDLVLAAFQDFEPVTLPAPGTYRVRFSASGMDEAHDVDVRMPEEPEIDRYLLQLWPAPARPDEIVRQTSSTAAYWHGVAREEPLPPTEEEKAAAARAAEEERARELETRQRELEAHEWGGRAPSAWLRAIGGRAPQLAQLDRDLVDEIADLDRDRQRALVNWVARRACRLAGQEGVDWVAAALHALERGEALPPPFDQPDRAYARMFSGGEDKATFTSLVMRIVDPDEPPPPLAPEAAAVDSMLEAANIEPARAAIEAVVGAAAGEEDPAPFLAEVRRFVRRQV